MIPWTWVRIEVPTVDNRSTHLRHLRTKWRPKGANSVMLLCDPMRTLTGGGSERRRTATESQSLAITSLAKRLPARRHKHSQCREGAASSSVGEQERCMAARGGLPPNTLLWLTAPWPAPTSADNDGFSVALDGGEIRSVRDE